MQYELANERNLDNHLLELVSEDLGSVVEALVCSERN